MKEPNDTRERPTLTASAAFTVVASLLTSLLDDVDEDSDPDSESVEVGLALHNFVPESQLNPVAHCAHTVASVAEQASQFTTVQGRIVM